MLEKFLIYTKTIDYIVWLFPVINTFPKAQRFVLGQQLEVSALRFLEQVIRANNQTVKADRLAELKRADVDLAVLRALVRVSYELKFLSHDQFAHSAQLTTELGKMLGGWQKQTASV